MRRKNVLKDFVSIAGPLNVSHFIVFTKNEAAINMRLIRLPRGPTMTFKVHSYALLRDVVGALKRPNMEGRQFKHHPLLVMNGFSGDGMHLKLMTTMFQNLFPSINVNTVKLNDIRRCVLLNYNADTKTVDFRHYNIRAVPVGMSRGIKKVVRGKIPDLGHYDDISEYLMKGGNLSESEAELDGPHNEVELPQAMASRGNMKTAKSAIRLTEIGPRMSLQLVKIEEGMAEGNILYHEFIKKTEEEVAATQAMRKKKQKQKEQRKHKQQEDVRKKEEEKDEAKARSLKGMKAAAERKKDPENPGDGDDVEDANEEMGDIDYYRAEVGEEPEPELFPSSNTSRTKRKSAPPNVTPHKRTKFSKVKDVGQKERGFKGDKQGKGDAGRKRGHEQTEKAEMSYMDRRKKYKLKKKKLAEKKMKRRPGRKTRK
ncbi:hypothetical protein NP493_41g06030 [Ridgeia piscesae]|uniref:Brix domain-containing protein n=1 Tax=Ridgeia piscesae TaxID=27915 RepID=A0AAD9UJP7_RIDPI|nr:hypothetical protein NP493_41g06030 [Ridgeia piscesae]